MFFAAKLKGMLPCWSSVTTQHRHPPHGLRTRKDLIRWAAVQDFPSSVHRRSQEVQPAAAQAGWQHAARMGQEISRPPGEHVQRAAAHIIVPSY
jgi:hypothetical protein